MFSKLCKAIVFHKNLCTEVVRIWHPVEKKNRDYCLFLCWMTLEILYLKKVKIGFVDEEMFWFWRIRWNAVNCRQTSFIYSLRKSDIFNFLFHYSF